jgi:hypothetical protein
VQVRRAAPPAAALPPGEASLLAKLNDARAMRGLLPVGKLTKEVGGCGVG